MAERFTLQRLELVIDSFVNIYGADPCKRDILSAAYNNWG